MTDLKIRLYHECQEMVRQRVIRLQTEMDQIQQDANLETKSSAGDKYETGRAMLQIEKDRIGGQLVEARKLAQGLDQLNPEKKSSVIGPGCIVKTSNGHYFIAVSLGKVRLENTDYFVLSSGSPLAGSLLNKKAGETIDFRGQAIQILEVE